MDSTRRIELLGCPFDAVSMEDTLGEITRAVTGGERMQIMTANVDFVMKARLDPSFAALLWEAEMVVADGVPILWAASLLGTPLKGRVNGTDLVWGCGDVSAKTGCPVALVGAGPGVAERAADSLRKRYSGARVHAVPTPFPLDSISNASVVSHIRDIGAGIVLVALGAPRQDRWIRSYLAECGANVGIGVGSALDLISGDRARAPKWMQKMGLEWFHRMLQEPGRLGRRYLLEDSPFVYHIIKATLKKRRGSGPDEATAKGHAE